MGVGIGSHTVIVTANSLVKSGELLGGKLPFGSVANLEDLEIEKMVSTLFETTRAKSHSGETGGVGVGRLGGGQKTYNEERNGSQ